MSRYTDYAASPPSEQEFYEREWVQERRAELRHQALATKSCDGPLCPECGCGNLRCKLVDYGVDSQTGYHDAGEMYICTACGSTEVA